MSAIIILLTFFALSANYIVYSEMDAYTVGSYYLMDGDFMSDKATASELNGLAAENVICYYGTWATYRPGLGKFDVDHVNPDLCSHLVYAFVGINNQGTVISLDSYLDLPDNEGRDNFGKFNALKQKSPKLKTLLAVGGWNEGSANYSIMAASPRLRRNFITTALNMVLTHGFDGFDLDWEYPNRRDTVNGQADIDNFTQLLKELRAEFDKHGLLMTSAVASVGEMAVLSYDIPAICKYLDVVGLMTYDLYGAWDPVTGHNAGLHKGEGDENVPREELYTVDVAVEYWIEKGCPPEKLVIGLPFYGRTFTLTNASNNGVRAPSSGEGISGPYTVSAGSIGYNELCNVLQNQTWDIRYDNLAKVPYAVQGRNWISYDDPNSLTEKIEYGLQKNVSGIMLWSIETDDFHGTCGEDYPLLRAINRALGRNIEDNELTTTESAETSTDATTTAPPEVSNVPTTAPADIPTEVPTDSTTADLTSEIPESSVCFEEGIISNPVDCAGFLMCVRDISGVLIPTSFNCPAGLLWDTKNFNCNYPELVTC